MKNIFKQFISNFKYNYSFLKVLNSPFVGLKLKWYIGKIEHGTPYFLPRKWVKCDMEDALEAWNKLSDDTKNHTLLSRERNKDRWLNNYVKSYTKAVQTKYFGWNFTSLGWKTKYDDYRFEWNPSLSIVVFGKQLFIQVLPKLDDIMKIDCYWETYLTYENTTDKTKSKAERLKELKEKHSCTYTSYRSGEEPVTTDYYQFILKKKYL